MQVPNAILMPEIDRLLRQGHTVTLPLKGFSMRPYLEDGRDKALLTPVARPLRRGDVILADISGDNAEKRYALHRIVKIDGDTITMYGDGNFSPEVIGQKDVIAIATGFYRKGREQIEMCDTLYYKAYWRLWLWLRPVRRYLLLLWRLCHYPRKTVREVINNRIRRVGNMAN